MKPILILALILAILAWWHAWQELTAIRPMWIRYMVENDRLRQENASLRQMAEDQGWAFLIEKGADLEVSGE